MKLDWDALHPRGAGHVELPPHGWEHQRFPLPGPGTAGPGTAERASGAARANGASASKRADGVLGGVLDGVPGAAAGGVLGDSIWVGAVPSLRLWRLDLNVRAAPELADHAVDGTPLVPGAYWLGAVAEAVGESTGSTELVMEDVVFAHPFAVDVEERAELQLGLHRPEEGEPGLHPPHEGERRFDICSRASGRLALAHAHGVVRGALPGEAPPELSLEKLSERCDTDMSVADLYAELERAGLAYGPRFRGLQELSVAPGEALARLRLPEGLGSGRAPLHPALLDAALHAVAAAARREIASAALALPVGVERLWLRRDRQPLTQGWCRARVIEVQERDVIAEITVLDDAGSPVLWAGGLRIRLAARRRRVEEGRLYRIDWNATQPTAGATTGGNWLLLADRLGVARALQRRLSTGGARCLLAVSDRSEGERERLLEPGVEAPYASLLAEAEGDRGELRGVIDARALTMDAGDPDAPALHETAARTLRLTQALLDRSSSAEQPRLWLLTAATQGDSAPSPALLAGSSLWGLGRVIDGELPEIGCSMVDLRWPVAERELDAVGEVLRNPDAPRQLRVRGEELQTPRLVTVAARPGSPALRLRSDRTYVVTGGLGTLGLLLADRLAARGARHLLLIGRSAPSPEAERELQRLRAAGVQVRVELVDVANATALAAALAGPGGSEPLGGVVHAAGVLEDGLISTLEAERLEAAFAGKALGAWNLHRLTRDQPIEQFVLFSSLAGLLGSPGQAAYAAANAFLDSLAAHRAALGLAAVSIDWGPWAGSGLAVEAQGVERLAARGVPPLDAAVALELFEQALDGGAAQVAATAFDWSAAGRSAVGPVARELIGELAPAQADGGAARGAARDAVLKIASATEREQALGRFLAEEVAGVLRIKVGEVDVDAPFQTLGFDSLMAIELRDRLEVALDTRLSAALLFAHPTVDSLAEGLLGRLAPDAERVRTAEDDEDATSAEGDGIAVGNDDLSSLDERELAALVSSELQLHSGRQGG